MKRNTVPHWGLVALLAAVLTGCAPKYAGYTSSNGDFRCLAPWRWHVLTDHEGMHYSDVTFIGPFDSRFYLGAPSLSVRWYRDYASHRLAGGALEMYADADDYIRQTLREVYGPNDQLFQGVEDILVSGQKAKHFVVLSAGPARPDARWGVLTDPKTGKKFVPRKHAYVVLPTPRGFYVLIYPATDTGYESNLAKFNTLVNTFFMTKDGPDGDPIAAAAGFSTRAAGAAR